jgi:O-antigen biosynthesis protein
VLHCSSQSWYHMAILGMVPTSAENSSSDAPVLVLIPGVLTPSAIGDAACAVAPHVTSVPTINAAAAPEVIVACRRRQADERALAGFITRKSSATLPPKRIGASLFRQMSTSRCRGTRVLGGQLAQRISCDYGSSVSNDTRWAGAEQMSASSVDDFQPIQVIEVELDEALPTLGGAKTESGIPYLQALVLARLHGQPLGLVEVTLPVDGGLAAETLAELLWKAFADRIRAHLRDDDLPIADRLTASGLPATLPRCVRERNEFLAEAPFISVILPTRERPDRLRTALGSILDCEYPNDRYEIVVVDNAPASEDTARLLREEFSGGEVPVTYAREDTPGSASARNRGLEAVSDELVAFTDDDVRVDRHWLSELARGFSIEPGASSVSGLLVPWKLDTAPQLWFEEYGGFSHGFDRRVYDLKENRPAEDPLYPYAAGRFGTANNLAFRRSALVALGGFDPALGNGTPALGGVDFEMMLRTILRGHRILYQPSAIVHHLHRSDYQSLRNQIYAYGAGMSAVMLKTLGSQPRLIPDFALRRLPRGLMFALSPSSSKNANKRETYPSELTRLELRGLVAGPLLYARSRRKYGTHVDPR